MIPNEHLYGNLPLKSSKVAIRRMKIAGRCVLHQEEEKTSKLTLWQTLHGRGTVPRSNIFYFDALLNDTGSDNVNELRTAMMHIATWKRLTELRRVKNRPK